MQKSIIPIAVPRSLFQKALLALVLVLLPTVIFFLLSYQSHKKNTEKQVLDDFTVIAEAYEALVFQFLDTARGRVEDLSRTPMLREAAVRSLHGDRSALLSLNRRLLEEQRDKEDFITALHLVAPRGRIIASSDGAAIGTDAAGEKYFRRGWEAAGAVEYRTGQGSPSVLALFNPVYDTGGKPAALLVADVSHRTLNRIMTNEYAGRLGALSSGRKGNPTLEMYLVNKGRFMITDSRFLRDAIMKQQVATAPVALCLDSNGEMSGLYRDYRGVEVVGVSMCMPDLGWTLIVEADADDVFGAVRSMKRDATIAGFAVAGLIALLSAAFYRTVIARLRTMSSVARGLASGKTGVRVPGGSGDEIGALAAVFNEMAGSIEARTAALVTSRARLANAQRIARIGSWEWDIPRNEIRWSDEIFRIFGLEPTDGPVPYDTFLGAIHPDDRKFVEDSVSAALAGAAYEIDHRIVRPDGTVRIVHERAEVVRDQAGALFAMTGTVQDVTESREREFELKKLTLAVEQSANAVFVTDLHGAIEYVNPKFEEVSGWSAQEVIGRSAGILASGETIAAEYEEMWKTIRAGKTWRGIFKNRKKDGGLYWSTAVISPVKNERGEISRFLSVQTDVTEMKKSEERIKYLAMYDDLTRLYNRTRFMRLLQEVTTGPLKDGAGVLLLCDIDNFNYVNDSFGHGVGDELLRRTGAMLQLALKERAAAGQGRAEAFLGRMGGDEFALFLPDERSAGGLEIADLIRARIKNLQVGQESAQLTMSIGVVGYPEHGTTERELFVKADAALYRAKERGPDRSHYFQSEDQYLEYVHVRLDEKARILKAIKDDRFVPWFQPIRDLNDGAVHHYEALARMKTEEGGVLAPAAFIETAENFGLVGEIDRIIIEKTVRLQADRARQGLALTFAMNVSGKNLGDENFLAFLQSLITSSGADPGRLVFEITETAAVHDIHRAVKFINVLKAMGCRFALDDFGVGFTSFVYLRELGVDYIKIDGYFVRKLRENLNDRLFVKAITDVARGMALKTIAEFVESELILADLKDLGVDYAQGYFVGKPAEELLDAHRAS